MHEMVICTQNRMRVDSPLRAVYTLIFAFVSPSAMTPLPNSFLCFSRAITYVIMQRKQLGGGAIADGETDAKNASVDCPLRAVQIVLSRF
jgi:hypothetical protein